MKPFSWSTEKYVAVFLFVVLWALIFYSTSLQSGDALKPPAFFSFRFGRPDRCAGRYVYMYDLPPRFNADLARDCRRLSSSTDMCRHLVNDGFGPAITDGGSLPESGAYATDQYMLDLIFHARMRRYECLTADPAAATAVYVPFYAGFDLAMNMDKSDLSERDALPQDMVDWLVRRPEWHAMGGRDHFMLASRPTWDFLRGPDGGWGNALMTYPAIRNMTVLAWEASPWHGNDFAVPFPSHFHPTSDADVVSWQSRMRRQERRLLWCFAGGSRPDSRKTGRNQIIEQCGRSSRCAMLGKAAATKTPGEYLPSHAMRLLESAEFCVQPRGDSYTRKSTFDSILAGCIPVFLHPISAYVQYTWYLPRDYRTYSVFIPQADVNGRNASIEEVLKKIPPAKVAQMREEVIRLIPTVMYRDPAAKGMKFKDAFDIAVERVIDRVAKRRRAAVEGREWQDSVDGYDSWKYDLLEDGHKEIGPHEFDPYISM
uniref:Uncharacterized protein n=1 Tax=Avena sativa TaxID=4498 RepID=A0ACD5TSR1_AVESA